jgi:predicted DNA-binding transcriptional regulator AlpA
MYNFKGSHLRNNMKSVRLADVLQCAGPRFSNVWTKAANKMYPRPAKVPLCAVTEKAMVE